MIDFLRDMSVNPFLLTGLIAGILGAVACGTIGPYVIARRIVFLVGAIAHMALGGIGAAIWLAWFAPDAFGWLPPIGGAVAASLLAAIVIAIVHDRIREHIDTVIGAMWAIGLSIGLMLLDFTPGYHVELMSFLFGNIVYVPWWQVWMTAAVVVVILVTIALMHRRLLALCLDEEHLALQGRSVLATNIVLLCLVALAVVALVQVVGLILVLALLTLPPATAGHWVRRIAPMMLVSIVLCTALTTLPRMAVYGTHVNASAAIVIAAAVVYLLSAGARRLLGLQR